MQPSSKKKRTIRRYKGLRRRWRVEEKRAQDSMEGLGAYIRKYKFANKEKQHNLKR
jgi:hypothetical protein